MRGSLALMVVTAAFMLIASPAAADFGVVTQWDTDGSGDGQFASCPCNIEVDPGGDVLVSEWDTQRVQRFSNTGVYLRQWATARTGGIGVAADGRVYLGNLLSTNEVDIYGSVGESLGTFKQFPEGIQTMTVDNAGNVYVITFSTTPGQVIRKYDSAGNLLAQWGSIGSGPGQVDGGGYDIAVDSQGNVYVVDPRQHRVTKFDPNGAFLTQWGSEGSGDGQFGLLGGRGLTVDANDTVWVADASNGRVQQFDTNGNQISKFGTLGNGVGQFDRPLDVATDSAGNVFVMDASNNRIVKLGQRPDPVPAKSMTGAVVSGVVLVRLPRARAFVPLDPSVALPIGTIVDARQGRVRITAVSGGKTIVAEFFEGQFQILQKGANGTADIKLIGGAFNRCPAGLRNPRSLGSKGAKPGTSMRHLWGEGAGKFRTIGRFSAATVRGTTWLTDDQCAGTNTRVTVGSVSVRDFVRKKTVVVTAGRSYIAKARRR